MNKKYNLSLLAIICVNLMVGILLLLNPVEAQAKEKVDFAKSAAFNEGCFRCHAAQGLRIKDNGQVISLYVNEEGYLMSQHATNKCTTCHTDIVDYPHIGALKGKNLSELKKKVNENCQKCHADVTKIYKNSVHGKANAAGKEVYCWSCHGVHNIMKRESPKAADFRNNIPETCGNCHNPEILESYKETFHGKAITLGSEKAATCVSCHGFHDITGPKDANSMVAKQNVGKTCAQCHYKAEVNFAEGTEHWTFKRGGPGEPMYWTLKFLVWLTLGTIVIFIIHVELDLFRRLKASGKEDKH